MKKIIAIIIIVVVGWYGNYYFGGYSYEQLSAIAEDAIGANKGSNIEFASDSGQFKCDGRIYCSQMTSCKEATFFIRNCPGTKMDGNNDGIPCEKQWCR